MPGIYARIMLQGHLQDSATVGECHNEKELSSEVRCSSLPGLSDISPTQPGFTSVSVGEKPRFGLSKMLSASSPLGYDICHTLVSKTGVLFVFRYPGMTLSGIARTKKPKKTFFRGQFMPDLDKRDAIR